MFKAQCKCMIVTTYPFQHKAKLLQVSFQVVSLRIIVGSIHTCKLAFLRGISKSFKKNSKAPIIFTADKRDVPTLRIGIKLRKCNFTMLSCTNVAYIASCFIGVISWVSLQ